MRLLRNLNKSLRQCTNSTPDFSLEGKIKICKVVNIYDGDTCKVVFDLKGTIYRWNVRMAGYDSPEMRPSKSNPNRDAEKIAANFSKANLLPISLPDKFGPTGTYKYLLEHHGLVGDKIAENILNFLKKQKSNNKD